MKLLEFSFWSAWSRSFLARLTVNRFTIVYFSFALVSCVVLVALQAITLIGNNDGVAILSGALSQTNATQARDGLPMMVNGRLALCDGIPGQSTVSCQILWAWDTTDPSSGNGTFTLDPRATDDTGQSPVHNIGITNLVDDSLDLPDNCIYSLRWLLDTLKDNKREDVVTLCFQIWMLSLAFVTVLYESIPHLGASLLGHVLGTGWAAYRVGSTNRLTYIYRQAVVPRMCSGEDFLKDWWDHRKSNAAGIVVVNACTLAVMMYLSYTILKIYARQSFARVGVSDQVRRIYKIILLFSAGLQLTGFFSLASVSIWLDKINQGVVQRFAIHGKLYLAVFVVTILLLMPWLVLGWVCVRRECARRYAVFCIISLFLVTLFTALFFSQIYRFIFLSWSFFATMTVTAYICIVFSATLGILCRFNFGKGLAHYLHVNDTLVGMNFTADTFYDHKADPENVFPLRLKSSDTLVSEGAEHHIILTKSRGSSVYSHPEGSPILLSSTPADMKSLITTPAHPVHGSTLGTKILITRDVETKQDPLPPVPAQPRATATTNRLVLRFSELPGRVSSLASLHQALDEFPLPPTAMHPVQEIRRYAPNSSPANAHQDDKTKNLSIDKSGWF